MEIQIKRSTVSEVEDYPEFPALVAEYAAESANEALGAVNPQMDTYRGMEAVGLLHVLSACLDDHLIGFLFLLTPVLPHFGRCAGVAESYFVASAHRKSGAGLRLLRAAEGIARDAGAVGLMVSAPEGGRLAQVMPGVGYRPASTVFFKELA